MRAQDWSGVAISVPRFVSSSSAVTRRKAASARQVWAKKPQAAWWCRLSGLRLVRALSTWCGRRVAGMLT